MEDAVDRWLFLFGVVGLCCCIYPPFLGVCIGVGLFYGVACVVYILLGRLMP